MEEQTEIVKKEEQVDPKLVFNQAGVLEFTRLTRLLKSHADEGNVFIENGVFHYRQMDTSQIAMLDVTRPLSENFQFVGAKDKFRVDFQKLHKVLKMGFETPLEVFLDPTKGYNKISVFGRNHITLADLTLDEDDRGNKLNINHPKEPKVETDASFEITAGELSRALKTIGEVNSSHVIFEVKDENGRRFLEVSAGDTAVLHPDARLEKTGLCRAMFPVEYLQYFVDAFGYDVPLFVSLKTDSPICITSRIGLARLKFYLAPRVENA